MYLFTDQARSYAGSYYPEQLFACSSREGWYNPWQSFPLPKHNMTHEGDAFPLNSFAAGPSVQRRPSSSYSGLSTPGLSWRDSSCSPVDEESPISTSEAISFAADVVSQTQNFTSSLKPAFPDHSAALYAAQNEAQTQPYTAYRWVPSSPTVPTAPHDLAAWQASLPSLGTALQEQALYSVAPVVESMSSMHSSSPVPSSSIDAPTTTPRIPELHHPKPVRAYVPDWQRGTEFKVEDFVIPSSHTNERRSPHESCNAASSRELSLEGVYVEQDERGDEYGIEETEMSMDWGFEDQGSHAQSQQDPALEDYAWSHPLHSTATMVAPQWASQRAIPQILPSDALLYQPVPSSVTAGLWADADPASYTYPHFS